MITILGMVFDLLDRGERQKAMDLLWNHTPRWQIKVNWNEVQKICDQAKIPETPPRPCNGLNIEIGSPIKRCMMRSPDGRGISWFLSGGSILAYGICEKSTCPLLNSDIDISC